MKRFSLLLSLLSICFVSLFSQSPNSSLGNVHTPEGDLHMLVIFIRYENVDLMRGSKQWPDSTGENQLPKFARGETNGFFHDNPEEIGIVRKKNVSDYYYAMSGGKFKISGDIYPVQVPIQYIPERRNNYFARQGQMNQAAINWITENDPDFDWSRYDNRTNRPAYRRNNVDSAPDSILDYVIFMHRAPGSTGMGSSSNVGIPGSRYRIMDGHTGIKSYTNTKHNWLYFKHEFAHNLFSCPHYLGANTADGDRFYTQKGWGLMAAWHAAFFTTNAWEAWWLGWINVQEIDTSGNYLLRDYVTGRDALRIRIPGTDDFLWLENHQKIDNWDEKMFFKDPNQDHPQILPGIYGFTVGAPGADRNQPKLSPFNAATVNFLRPLNAEGNYDWAFTGDSMSTGYFRAPIMEKIAPNPISGQHPYQFLRADYNGDDQIGVGFSHGNSDSGGKEQMDLWTERINGEDLLTLAGTGDENDGFQPGMELSLSSLTPVTSYPIYNKKTDELNPYILSGITVKVLSKDDNGMMNLEIDLNDWNIRRDVRWCGRMQVLDAYRMGDSISLRVLKGNQLSLELSGTPQRQQMHPQTGNFAPPTELIIGAGQTLIIERRAELVIRKNSKLVLEPGARLIVERGGRVEVENGGRIEVESDVAVEVGRFGRIVIQPEAEVSLGENVSLDKEFLGNVGWE